jgi:hypothetical protein
MKHPFVHVCLEVCAVRAHAIVTLALAGIALVAARAGAQSPAPTASPAAHHGAVLEERHASGTHGHVDLMPQGNKTQVLVTAASRHPSSEMLSLHSGRDCQDTFGSPAANNIQLNPLMGNNQSKTLISIPIGAFTSKHYVVDVHNATTRARFAEACARL